MLRRRTPIPGALHLGLLVLLSCSSGSGGRDSAARRGGDTSFLGEVLSLNVPLHGIAFPDSPAVSGAVDSHSVTLPSARRYRVWSWSGRPWDLVRVTATAAGFEPDILLLEPRETGYRLLDEGLATRGESSARAVAELPASGKCLIALAAPPGETGTFDIRTEVDSLPDFRGAGGPGGAFALLAGAGEYPGSGSDLPGAGSDIELMKNLLLRSGFDPRNILILRDGEITRTRLIKAFCEHLGRATKDGVALFYYSGHGIQLNGNIGLTAPEDPEEDGKDEALLMANGSIILDDEIGYLADELKADRTLLILDSCYSGTGSRAPGVFQKAVSLTKARFFLRIPEHFLFDEEPGTRGPAGTAESRSWNKGHVLIAASQENQPAMVIHPPAEDAVVSKGASGFETGASKKYVSLFTLCFAEVAAACDDLPLPALVDSVQARMRAVESELGIDRQTPALQGSEKMDLREILSTGTSKPISRGAGRSGRR